MSVTTPHDYSDETEYHDKDSVPMTLSVQIPSAIGIAFLIFFGIGGNLLTIIAYFKDKHFRQVYDFFILNLAITDLFLCSISMPFYAVYTLMEFTWPFGYSFCKVWSVSDFTLCFESILLMLILSLDRYLLISQGPLYMQNVTTRIAYIEVTVSWIVSFLAYGPAIIGWNHWVGYSIVEDMDCDVEFAYDRAFTTATSVVEFILPFFCLTSLNLLIYYKIRQRVKIFPKNVRSDISERFVDVRKQSSSTEKQPTASNVTLNCKRKNSCEQTVRPTSITKNIQPKQASSDVTEFAAVKNDLTSTASRSKPQFSGSRSHARAAKFLAILVVAFLIFWAPYTITTMAISFCDDCINTSLYEFFNWLLWMKAAVNPFLYALNSARYRKSMLKYLTLNGKLCILNIREQRQQTTVTSVY